MPATAMTPELHVSEYHDSMVAFLEWIWGRDFMAPGGELISEAQTGHMIEDWRSMVVVCEKGELCQGYTRGRRPTPGSLLWPVPR